MPTKTRKVNKANPLTGSSLDDFLRDEGILEEVEAAALKRVMAVLEDVDDLAVVAKRRREPTIAHEEIVAALKAAWNAEIPSEQRSWKSAQKQRLADEIRDAATKNERRR
jgi:hypothetical protein